MAGSGSNGEQQYAAQLARVMERRPRVAAIHSTQQQQLQQLRLVVKIRPRLVHYIVNGVVMCVIMSLESITDVVELASESGAEAQLLVAVADGIVWRVTLPTKPLGVLHQVVLQQKAKATQRLALSNIESVDTPMQVLDLIEDDSFTTQDAANEHAVACRVERFCQVPGVQYVVQCSDCTVCTSVIAPSTLVWKAGDKDAESIIELEELEAEQSTCVAAFRGDSSASQAILRWLFRNEPAYADAKLLLLQGDADGAVRYYVTSEQGQTATLATVQPPRSGTLLELGEPVQFIVPFSVSTTVGAGSDGARSSGLLIVGYKGHAHLLVLDTKGSHRDSISSSSSAAATTGVSVAFDAPVQSIVFVESLDCFVYCSQGAAYGFRASDLIYRSSSSEFVSSASSKRLVAASPQTEFSAKLPFVLGVVAVALHEDSQALSLVYASGRVVSMDQTHLTKAIAHIFPQRQSESGEQGAVAASPLTSSSNDTNESRIKSLLQRISQVSTSSTQLRAQSEQLDAHLRHLHAALLIQKHMKAHGIQSLFHCKLDLALKTSGSFSHKKAVNLTCRIDATKLDFLSSSLSCWLVSIQVRSRKQQATTFVFPLEDVLHSHTRDGHGRERSMFLDDDTLEFHDNGGVLLVSCSLIFQPGHVFETIERHQKRPRAKMENGSGKTENSVSNDDSLFSFAIPLVQDKVFHLVQLSEILEADNIPTSHVAIRAAFRQDQDPSLPLTSSTAHSTSKNNNKEISSQPGLLLQGYQLWSALAAHWEDKALAGLWLRDLQSQPHELGIAPPSRFTMVFPAFALKELTMDHVVSIVRSVLRVPASMKAKLHESCRNQSGKFWVGLKTFSGNLVVLRFSLDESIILIDGEMLRPLEVLLQCSSADDLSTMRALLLEGVPRSPGHEEMSMPLDEVFSALSLEASEFRGSLAEAETLALAVVEKISTSLQSSESSLCTDEVVRMLTDVARVETQTLKLYWKSRHVLNKFVI